MKKSNSHSPEDQDLYQFFNELKDLERKNQAPDPDQLIEDGSREKRPVISFWRYAAVIALLIIGFGTYQVLSDEPAGETTEIIISYEFPEKEEIKEEHWQPPGIDQWQSETDILLTGL